MTNEDILSVIQEISERAQAAETESKALGKHDDDYETSIWKEGKAYGLQEAARLLAQSAQLICWIK